MGYSKESYLKAKTILDRRRIESENALEERRNILFNRSPEARELERRIARTSLDAARAVYSGKDVKSELENLKIKNQTSQKRIDDIIAKLGFPPNYLEKWYKCDKCQDTGYVNDKMCTCMKNIIRDFEYERINNSSSLKLCGFDTLSVDYYDESERDDMKKILDYCKDYANGFSQNSRSILMMGKSGLGKTHISLAIAKAAVDRGYSVIYVSASTVCKKMEYERFNEKIDDTERALMECDLLIFDDLGTEFMTAFLMSTLYTIINKRLAESKPTIMSTNFDFNEIPKIYDQRISSRILGAYKVLTFTGKDIRVKQAIEGLSDDEE
ncbi:MAG: ATP-binding protein [Clostridia bacterium]|nr:ATP-binding protein [Clostridia bacterium]